MGLSRFAAPLAMFVLAAAPLHAGPPWIAVELPPNPFDQASRGAFLLVRVFHHGGESGDPVTGRAVGLVDGRKQSIALRFDRTSRPGVYALKPQWGERGEWSLILTNAQDHGDAAEVMVKVSGTRVIGVEAATKPSRHRELAVEPRRFTEAEVEASLAGRGR
ncbi:MAG: hypothetical protein FJ206_11650 [Gemmatimonadetes bacterium]|nr:hypothetical protein [Gemmatimonadota bacterium]